MASRRARTFDALLRRVSSYAEMTSVIALSSIALSSIGVSSIGAHAFASFKSLGQAAYVAIVMTFAKELLSCHDMRIRVDNLEKQVH